VTVNSRKGLKGSWIISDGESLLLNWNDNAPPPPPVIILII
jgi:hypothetical protein